MFTHEFDPEVDGISRISRESFLGEDVVRAIEFYPGEFKQTRLGRVDHYCGATVAVSSEDHEVIGYADWCAHQGRSEDRLAELYFSLILVVEEERKKGIGATLIDRTAEVLNHKFSGMAAIDEFRCKVLTDGGAAMARRLVNALKVPVSRITIYR